MERDRKQDVVFALVRNVVSIRYEDLPAEAVEATKKDILDTLATTLAGSTSNGIKVVQELVCDWGGKKESTIIVYGGKVPSLNAALVNATMAHACDYDDYHSLTAIHAGVSAIPASLAIAERRGKITGKEFITAIALGIDLMCRLGISVGLMPATHGWHNTSVYGAFGSTAACGKILGLDENKMINALGIVYSQAAGNAQCMRDGALSKRMQPGFAAKAAVLSSLLAEKGYTGARSSLEGKYGLFNVYHRGKYDPTALTFELGKSFEVCNLAFKPYPSCGLTHNAIGATLELVSQYNIKPEMVDKIVVSMGEDSQHVVCEPVEIKRRPQVAVDAQFSLPYTVARAVVHRKVCLGDLSPEAFTDEITLQVAQRVEPRLMAELTTQRGLDPAIVEIKTMDGKAYSKRMDIPKGNPKNPLTMNDLVEKFRDCASYSAKSIPQKSIERAIQLTLNLEEVEDIRQIIRLLS